MKDFIELSRCLGMTVFERGWLSSNSILFEDAASTCNTLVDTGYWSHGEQTVALVRRALADRPLHRILNTHLHSDHCGGNHALQLAYECEIAVPVGDASKVDEWDVEALTYRATGQHCPRFSRTGAMRPGDSVQLGEHAWLVVAAPGHDPHSVMLFEQRHGILISADALWGDGFGVVFPELGGPETDGFSEVEATLREIGKLRPHWVIPGHGSPFQDCAAALRRADRRLQTFVADPKRHAWHAAKVLIKFRMLELQSCTESDLLMWMSNVEYLRLVHRTHFDGSPFVELMNSALAELVDKGHLKRQFGILSN